MAVPLILILRAPPRLTMARVNRPRRVTGSMSQGLKPLLLYAGLWSYYKGRHVVKNSFKKFLKYGTPVIFANKYEEKRIRSAEQKIKKIKQEQTSEARDADVLPSTPLKRERPLTPPPTLKKRIRIDGGDEHITGKVDVAEAMAKVVKKRNVNKNVKKSRGKITRRNKSKRSTKKKSRKNKKFIDFAHLGCLTRTEHTFEIVDPNVSYVYVHDNATYLNYILVLQALIRKLLERSFKTKYGSIHQPVLSGQSVIGTANMYSIHLTWINKESAGISSTDVPIVAASTIATLATAYLTIVTSLGVGDGAAQVLNSYEFVEMRLFKLIFSGVSVTDELLVGRIGLQEEVVQLQVETRVKFQNRSVSSDNSPDKNNVNMTPLEVHKYKFSGIPKYKFLVTGQIPILGGPAATTGGSLFSRVNVNTGVMSTTGAALFAASTFSSWKQFQGRKHFNNCSKVTSMKMQPGAHFTRKMLFKRAMPFNAFLAHMMRRIQQPAAIADAIVSETVGHGEMFSFEDLININSTYNITISFEVDRVTKACLVTKRSNPIQTEFI